MRWIGKGRKARFFVLAVCQCNVDLIQVGIITPSQCAGIVFIYFFCSASYFLFFPISSFYHGSPSRQSAPTRSRNISNPISASFSARLLSPYGLRTPARTTQPYPNYLIKAPFSSAIYELWLAIAQDPTRPLFQPRLARARAT